MSIMISYFYQIRNFVHGMIPFSTAMWDPKWYHDGHCKEHTFKDHRGILNGLRAEELVPGPGCNSECRGPDSCENHNPDKCNFLRHYRDQLDELDFKVITSQLELVARSMNSRMMHEGDSIAVLMVYESPDNPCSERRVLRKWFMDHGMLLPEFRR